MVGNFGKLFNNLDFCEDGVNTMKTEIRGGARPGAGAPKKDPLDKRVKTSIQLPFWMLEQIDQIAGPKRRSKAIFEILSKHFFKIQF